MLLFDLLFYVQDGFDHFVCLRLQLENDVVIVFDDELVNSRHVRRHTCYFKLPLII